MPLSPQRLLDDIQKGFYGVNSFPVQICSLGINIEQIYKMNSETIIVSTCAPCFLFLYHFTFKRRFISGVSKMIPSFLSVVRTWHVFCQNKELLKNTGRKTDKPEVQRLPLFHNSPSCEAHSQETQDWPEDHSVNNLWFQFLFLASCLVCLKDFTIWKASIS